MAEFAEEKAKSQNSKEAGLAIMICLIVAIFVICNSFECLMFILSSQGVIPKDITEDYLRPLADLLIVVNSSVNVFIYTMFSETFRKRFFELYIQPWWKKMSTNQHPFQKKALCSI